MSQHSMWIYLWHILVLTVYEKLQMVEIWYLELLIVYAVSISIVFIVNVFLDKIEIKKRYGWVKYLRC